VQRGGREKSTRQILKGGKEGREEVVATRFDENSWDTTGHDRGESSSHPPATELKDKFEEREERLKKSEERRPADTYWEKKGLRGPG